jgi:hypothetical protein
LQKRKKNIPISEDNVFMIASNSTYEEFYNRFFGEKKYKEKNEDNYMEELNDLLKKRM